MISRIIDLLTKYPVFIAIAIALLSALVGLISALLTTFISNSSQSDREREKWVREKLQEIYSNSIGSLIALRENINVQEIEKQHFIEAEKWLDILLIYQSKENKKHFSFFREEVFLFANKQWVTLSMKYEALDISPGINSSFYGERYTAITGIITRVMEIATKDERLH